ncbi:MAG: primosomal protein N' [Lachnospiraceae bacterium]|nr:primosomal protein N' [Lachnospiraceae bacterium]
MALYADVIIDTGVRDLDRVFQYRIPEDLEGKIGRGTRVRVPFGAGNRMSDAFVTDISDKAGIAEERIKDIESSYGAPDADGKLIELAGWIRNEYSCTLSQALSLVLPVKKKVREIMKYTYVLEDREKAEHLLEELSRDRRRAGAARFLSALLSQGTVPEESLKAVIGVTAASVRKLTETGAVARTASRQYRDPQIFRLSPHAEAELNDEQSRAADDIWENAGRVRENWNTHDAVHLLYGITGSGKTEVYIELIRKTLAEGRKAIVLIPEISLTPQTVSRFYERFGELIAVTHSRLSAGERYDQYMKARSGEASIMIGPRSAVFAPFDNIGLIIIDEEHDGAYKSEKTPKYHAAEIAAERARKGGALLVLGSATPSLRSYSRASKGEYSLHVLRKRARESSVLPQVSIADMRAELAAGNRSIFSRELYSAIEQNLEHHEQTMLFLNRRGYAGFVSCRSCGEVIKCPHCEVSLTSHRGGRLKCHYCGYEAAMPEKCPSCGSPYIGRFGIGTEKVEDLVRKTFPSARVLRMDRDTTSAKDSAGKIVSAFASGKADILIGTQMIVKGHDFENVTLVGILAADTTLFSGDYMSTERTFQLLTQAAGRAGRGAKPGKVVIQTYKPDHYCIRTAAEQDFPSFYDKEIKFRSLMGYPPAGHMLLFLLEGADEEKVKSAAEQAASAIRYFQNEGSAAGTDLLGPSPAAITKLKDLYRYVLYVKCLDEGHLRLVRDSVENELKNKEYMKNIYLNSDIDPLTIV